MLWDLLEQRCQRTPPLAAGLMAGTSLDGVDAVVVEWTAGWARPRPRVRAALTAPFAYTEPDRLREIAEGGATSVEELGELRQRVSLDHATAVRAVCAQGDIEPSALAYVAAHGVTLSHSPPHRDAAGHADAHSWQLLSGASLAVWLDVVVIDDFRSPDVAAGGQGAPLAPLCDCRLWASPLEDRAILNLGGIANITLLPAGAGSPRDVVSGDVGPANLPLDLLRRRQTDGREPFDRDGERARRGRVDPTVREAILRQGWVRRPLPRSYGREEFGPDWLDDFLRQAGHLSPDDQLATLVAIEAAAVAAFVEAEGRDWRRRPDAPWRLYVTGGGRHNRAMLAALDGALPEAEILGMEALGISADAKEAMDFALLGWLLLRGEAAGSSALTGSDRELLLGSLHLPPPPP